MVTAARYRHLRITVSRYADTAIHHHLGDIDIVTLDITMRLEKAANLQNSPHVKDNNK